MRIPTVILLPKFDFFYHMPDSMSMAFSTEMNPVCAKTVVLTSFSE